MHSSLRRRTSAGFSLVEILIAVLLIGILMAVALPRLFSAREAGGDSAAQQQLRTAQNEAIASFYQSNQYPTQQQLEDKTGIDIVAGAAGEVAGTSARAVGYSLNNGTLVLTSLGGENRCWYLTLDRTQKVTYGLGSATMNGGSAACSPTATIPTTNDFAFPAVTP